MSQAPTPHATLSPRKRTGILLTAASAFLLLYLLTACSSSRMSEPIGVGSDSGELKRSPCSAMLPSGAFPACTEIRIRQNREIPL